MIVNKKILNQTRRIIFSCTSTFDILKFAKFPLTLKYQKFVQNKNTCDISKRYIEKKNIKARSLSRIFSQLFEKKIFSIDHPDNIEINSDNCR